MNQNIPKKMRPYFCVECDEKTFEAVRCPYCNGILIPIEEK